MSERVPMRAFEKIEGTKRSPLLRRSSTNTIHVAPLQVHHTTFLSRLNIVIKVSHFGNGTSALCVSMSREE